MAAEVSTSLRHHVLVTGSAGAIGRSVVKELLARGHRVRGLDLRPTPDLEDFVTGPISDRDLVEAAVAGTTAIVHLAATVDDADFMTELLPNNIVGVYNIFAAALQQGVKRVALASSMQVTSGLPKTAYAQMVAPTEAAPTNGYAVTKLFAEDLGHMFWLRHHIEVVCARIGFLPRDAVTAAKFEKHPHIQNVYLSHADAGRFFACAVEAPNVGYAVLWATSRRPNAIGYDLAPSKAAIGYEPQDHFPEGLEFPFP